MAYTRSQLNGATTRPPVADPDATPFSQQAVVLTKQDYIELKWKANYWHAQYERLLKREADLKAQVATHEATIRDLKQRLYGKKSEKSSGSERVGASEPASRRKRGQQPGSLGHGRSDRSALPVVDEVHDLDATAACCPGCGEPFSPFPGAEESSIIEVEVQAHRRRIYRPRYQKMCDCPGVPGLVTAPPAPRVIPKSSLGVSVWTRVLLDKYLYGRPTYRLCQEQAHHICRDTKIPIWFPAAASTLSNAYAHSGDLETARHYLDQIVDPLTSIRYVSLGYFVEATMLVGRLSVATDLAQRGLERGREENARGEQAHLLHLLGDLAMLHNPPRPEQGESHYRAALALATELGMRPLQAHSHRDLGMLFSQTGLAEQARAELSTAVDMYRNMEMSFWLPETETALAEVKGKT